MTYEELVARAREVFGKADASGIQGHVAYQFNITGEGEGAFYLEIDNGTVKVEPYEYFDRDVLFTMTAKNLIKIGLGELDPVWAFTTGRLKLEGSIEKALLLKDLAASVKERLAKETAGETADIAGETGEETEQKAQAGDDDALLPPKDVRAAEIQTDSAVRQERADGGPAGFGWEPEEAPDGAGQPAEEAPDGAGQPAGESDQKSGQESAAGIRLAGQLVSGRGNKNKRNRKKKRR